MLIDKLIEKQRQEGLSDRLFAQKLGVSRQLWQFTRTGRTRIGERVCRGALRAYPDLTATILLFLQSASNIVNRLVPTGATPTENATRGAEIGVERPVATGSRKGQGSHANSRRVRPSEELSQED